MSPSALTILVVDDEPEILDSLQRQLRNQGYSIATATSAADALVLLAGGGIDLLLTDIDMPGMNGLELAALVRRKYPEVARMLLTGDASLDSALDAINRGEVHRYLTKPWHKDTLRQTIQHCLERLVELRRIAAAERGLGQRERLLAELERAHPGILTVHLVDGAYVIDGAQVARVLAGLTDSAARDYLDATVALDGQAATRRLR